MAAFLLDEEERLEDNVDQAPEQEVQQEQQEEVDDIPDKYKGKSVKDIVRMHQEAEKLAGRHSSEIGELRKIVDDFVVSQTELKKEKKKPVKKVKVVEVTDTDATESEIELVKKPKRTRARKIEPETESEIEGYSEYKSYSPPPRRNNFVSSFF